MTTSRRGFLERRGAAALMLGLFVAGGLVFVFAGTLSRVTRSEAEAATARAEVARLEAQVQAGRSEIAFVETPSFVDQFARSVNHGTQSETPFQLPDDAPSPPPIRPIGAGAATREAQAPLEAWMELLFGG